MPKRLRRLLCLTLCAVLCILCVSTGSAATSVTLTAVNDSFLPLSSSTMPTRKGGALYVPYAVFTGTLGVSGAYNASEQALTLSAGSSSLVFRLDNGTVYDQNMTSYATPAYSINGTVYVPVKLVCGKFSLTYSNITAAAPILRICNDNASLSDSAFVSNMSDTIRSMLDSYSGQSTGTPSTGHPATPGGQTPGTTVDPVTGQPTEQPVTKPSAVYLTYLGTPNDNTAAILDALDAAGQRATFFLTADGTPLDGDLLRALIGRGHTVGFLLLSTAAEMPEKLRAANDVLFRETGTVSPLLCISDGSAALSADQQAALTAAGYRIWDAGLDSRDHSYGAADAARTVTTACSQTTAQVVVRMGHYGATANATALICGYLQQNAVPAQTVTLTRTPIVQRAS